MITGNFFSTVFSCLIKLDKFGDVLNDHFFEMQTKLIPLCEYSDCNLNSTFSTSVFLEILFSIVSISKGSAAAKTIASISFSIEDNLVGKFINIQSRCSKFLLEHFEGHVLPKERIMEINSQGLAIESTIKTKSDEIKNLYLTRKELEGKMSAPFVTQEELLKMRANK